MDYFQIDPMLTKDESRFRDGVRDFVDEECLPVIADHFDRGTFPMQLIPREEIRGFFVEAGTLGFQSREIQRKFSYRTSSTSVLDFKNCEIPAFR